MVPKGKKNIQTFLHRGQPNEQANSSNQTSQHTLLGAEVNWYRISACETSDEKDVREQQEARPVPTSEGQTRGRGQRQAGGGAETCEGGDRRDQK